MIDFLSNFLWIPLFIQWDPPKLEFISNSMVEQYFSKIDDEEWEDLQLPARFHLPGYAAAKL